MNQSERRRDLIQYFLDENPQYRKIQIPAASWEQKQLLRGLMNVRPPKKIGEDFLAVQDEYLAVDTVRKFQKETNSGIEVVFNVFKESDKEIYTELLGAD